MSRLQRLLSEYGACHAHPVNQAVHWLFVPVIMFGVVGLFWALPVPGALAGLPAWANWGTAFAAACMVYYAALSRPLALGMLVVLAALLPAVGWASTLETPLWRLCAGLLAVSLAAQLAGHRVEGRRPAFFRDVEFILVGPLWLLAKLYQRLGLRY